MSRLRALGSCCWVVLAVGCSGGQSGTEGADLIVCEAAPRPRCVGSDEVPRLFEVTLNQIAVSLAARSLPGRWLTGDATELSVELDASLGARELSWLHGKLPCETLLEVDALHVRTSDGSIDAVVPARIARGYEWGYEGVVVDATLPELPSALLVPTALRDYDLLRDAPRSAGGTALRVVVDAAMTDAIVYDQSGLRGAWRVDAEQLPWGSPSSFTPDPLLSAACVGSAALRDEHRHYTPFPSTSAALAGVAGVWARCQDGARSSHAGIEILPDGSWRHFDVEAGELVGRSGFGHEGYVELTALSDTSLPDSIGLELQPFGRNHDAVLPIRSDVSTLASESALVFHPDIGPPDWPAAVYQPTQLAVRPVAPEFASDERAGASACDRPEHSLVFDPAAAASLLTGEFVLCSGSLHEGPTRLRFQPAEVELLAADGSVLRNLSRDASSTLLRLEGGQWRLHVSRQPLKVLIEEERGSTLDRGFLHWQAVFSAVP